MPKAVTMPTTPVTLARRRHVRAAPGALDRRWPAPETPAPTKPTVTRPLRKPAGSTKSLVLRLSRTEDDGLPRGLDFADGFATPPGQPAFSPLLRWTGSITPGFRRRIERDVELLIAYLDALDSPSEDLEPDDEGCCAAEDQPITGMHELGDLDDAEDGGDLERSGDECEPSDGNDMGGDRLFIVSGGVPA